ncbi:MAG: PepSY domain-containing protein [Pirellulaceae bacterium]|nr:PepSY domain-containing protein [Pirellulaceae bacterium]
MKLRTWRKIHRYLGVVIGIQLFFWTLSGVIFSWNSIQSVRGEDLIRKIDPVNLNSFEIINSSEILKDLPSEQKADQVLLRTMLEKPVYEVSLVGSKQPAVAIFDASSGKRLSPIDAETARQIAERDFAFDVAVNQVERITETGSHSEYRGKELPAYRVEMDHPSGTSIYVSENRGVVTTRRNNQWRVFDFFWMLHTMDYQGRDNFNQWLLKTVSIFGLVTVISGFGLWVKTSPIFRKRRKS